VYWAENVSETDLIEVESGYMDIIGVGKNPPVQYDSSGRWYKVEKYPATDPDTE
jgi:hypothetical protein